MYNTNSNDYAVEGGTHTNNFDLVTGTQTVFFVVQINLTFRKHT